MMSDVSLWVQREMLAIARRRRFLRRDFGHRSRFGSC